MPPRIITKTYDALNALLGNDRGSRYPAPESITPVIIVDDIRPGSQAAQGLIQGVTAATSGESSLFSAGSPAARNQQFYPGVWISGTTVVSFANNTGQHAYRLSAAPIAAGGKGFRLEELRVIFDTLAAPVSTAAVFGLILWPYTPGTLAAAPNMLDQAQVSYSRMSAPVAGTSYYVSGYPSWSGVANGWAGDTTDFPGVAQTARTFWQGIPLPNVWIQPGGAIDIYIRTAAAAGGGIDNFAFKATVSIAG